MTFKIQYVEPLWFLSALILYINVPIEKQLIYMKVCLGRYNESFCNNIRDPRLNHSHEENLVQMETAQYDMINNILRTLPTIASTIFLGTWSDGVGRKKVLIIPVFGETFNAVCYFFNAYYFAAPVPFIFVGSIVTGFCGNLPTMLMAVLAYVSDTTTLAARTMRLTVLESLAFLASIVSLFTAGAILQTYGFIPVYILDMIITLVMMVYILFLDESYYPEQRVSLREVITKNKLKESIQMFAEKRYENYHAKVLLFTGCFCTLFFITTGIDEILILYLLHTPLNFLPAAIGYVLASESSIKFIGAMFVTSVLISRYKWNDSSLILLCSLAVGGYGVCIGLSNTDVKIYLSTLWGFGVCAGVAACRSGLTKLVSMEEQGKLNSVVCALQEIMLLLVTIICNTIYKATLHITPSFTLYFLGGLSILPVLLSLVMKMYERKESDIVMPGY